MYRAFDHKITSDTSAVPTAGIKVERSLCVLDQGKLWAKPARR